MNLHKLIALAQRAIAALEGAQPLAQLAARLYVAQVFFQQGQVIHALVSDEVVAWAECVERRLQAH